MSKAESWLCKISFRWSGRLSLSVEGGDIKPSGCLNGVSEEITCPLEVTSSDMAEGVMMNTDYGELQEKDGYICALGDDGDV